MSSEDIHRAEHTEDQQHTRENGHDDELWVNRFLVAFIWKNHKDKKINTLKKMMSPCGGLHHNWITCRSNGLWRVFWLISQDVQGFPKEDSGPFKGSEDRSQG